MKNNLFTLLISFIAIISFGQHESNQKIDSTRIKIGTATIILVNTIDNEKYDYDFTSPDSLCLSKKNNTGKLLIDVGTNGYLTSSNQLSLPEENHLMELNYSRSRAFGISFLFGGIDLVKDKFYFTPGLGITWNGYHFENNINISTSNEATVFSLDTVFNNSKYKLRATYLEIPLLLGVKTNTSKKSLHLQAGIISGFKISSIIKQKYHYQGANYKNKISDNFNLNPFKFDVVTRISVGSIGLYARYSITTLFEENKALKLYPFSAGITISEF